MKIILIITVLSAIAFTALASLNNVYAWPLIFPLVAGFAAMRIIHSQSVSNKFSFVFKKALVGSVVVMVLSILAYFFLLEDKMFEQFKSAGFSMSKDGLNLLPAIVLMLILGGIYLVSFLIGAGLGQILKSRRSLTQPH